VIQRYGNMFEAFFQRTPKGNVTCPINEVLLVTAGSVVQNGVLLMETGAAQQLRSLLPGIDARFGQIIVEMGVANAQYGVIVTDIFMGREFLGTFGLFQTRINPRQRADADMIFASAQALFAKANEYANVTFHLNFPGIGHGGLVQRKQEILGLLQQFPSNVHVWELQAPPGVVTVNPAQLQKAAVDLQEQTHRIAEQTLMKPGQQSPLFGQPGAAPPSADVAFFDPSLDYGGEPVPPIWRQQAPIPPAPNRLSTAPRPFVPQPPAPVREGRSQQVSYDDTFPLTQADEVVTRPQARPQGNLILPGDSRFAPPPVAPTAPYVGPVSLDGTPLSPQQQHLASPAEGRRALHCQGCGRTVYTTNVFSSFITCPKCGSRTPNDD